MASEKIIPPTGDGRGFNRRDFLRTGSLGALGLLAGSAVELRANTPPAPAATGGYSPTPAGPDIRFGVVGVGPWGRELIALLSALPGAKVQAVCESYAPFLRRARNAAPEAEAYEDFRRLLEDPNVDAVIVATPSHQHREIAVAALEAGKHVYCEAPLATSIEDARAIAQAAASASGQIFQAGQQLRSNPQHHHVLNFVRTGALGQTVMARGQWHKRESWRRVSPNREREEVANWRLYRKTSPGLMGEIGLHHLDVAAWFLNAKPLAVSGFGGIRHWKDGRDVPDTVQTVFEFPGGLTYSFSASLANSFEGDYDAFYGSDSAILLRDHRAWMFREPDAPLLGWEVYAHKEEFFNQTGISLVADATKLITEGLNPSTDSTLATTPIRSAMESFIACIHEKRNPVAGYQEGFDAVVMALKANEAVLAGRRIEIDPSSFAL